MEIGSVITVTRCQFFPASYAERFLFAGTNPSRVGFELRDPLLGGTTKAVPGGSCLKSNRESLSVHLAFLRRCENGANFESLAQHIHCAHLRLTHAPNSTYTFMVKPTVLWPRIAWMVLSSMPSACRLVVSPLAPVPSLSTEVKGTCALEEGNYQHFGQLPPPVRSSL
jgi:hypothetical protein